MRSERAVRALVAASGLALMAALAGCGGVQAVERTTPAPAASPAAAPAEARPAKGSEQAQAQTAVAYEIVKPADLPAEIAIWADRSSIPKTLPHARIGEYVYVMAAVDAGSGPGATVTVNEVERVTEGGRPLLRVEAMATTGGAGLTTPRSFIRIPWPAANPDPQVVISLSKAVVVKSEGPSTPVASPANPGPTRPASPSTTEPAPPTTTQPTAPAAAQPAGPLVFRPVDVSALPDALSTWRQAMEDAPTGAAAYADNALFVMAAAGEQRSGGYRVEIRGVEMKDGKLIVTAVLHKPAPGAMVTMALTYPKSFARVELKGSGTPQVQVNWQ